VRLRAVATLFSVRLGHAATTVGAPGGVIPSTSPRGGVSPRLQLSGAGHSAAAAEGEGGMRGTGLPYKSTRLTLAWGVWIATELALRRCRVYLPQGSGSALLLLVVLVVALVCVE
jgi:hypothetical protein